MIDKELSLIVYPVELGEDPPFWVAESQHFKYLHPLDGKEEAFRFQQKGASAEEAREKAQKQLDWFNGDRGHCITEIEDFTAEQLAKVTPV
jgi:hypothetical protein